MADRPAIWNPLNADHRLAFATAMAPLVSILWKRKEDFGRTEATIYMRTLKHVPAPILVAAVERALEVETWFPEPAKLLVYAADELDAQRKAAGDKWLTDCVECHGSRWVDVGNHVQRCGCWTRAMQAIRAVGEPIKRPRLEASTAPEPS